MKCGLYNVEERRALFYVTTFLVIISNTILFVVEVCYGYVLSQKNEGEATVR